MKGGEQPFEAYTQVPTGATVQVTIAGDGGAYNADSHLISSSEELALIPGPGAAQLQGPRNYFLRARIAFLAAGNPTLEIVILRPDGTVHSERCRWQVAGAAGTTEIRGAFIRTA